MTKNSKRWALILSSVAIIAMLFLAGGLSGLEFGARQPFLLAQLWADASDAPPTLPKTEKLILLFRMFLAVALVLFPFSLIYVLLSRKARKRLLRNIISLLLFIVLSYMLANGQLNLLNRNAITLPDVSLQPVAPGSELTFIAPTSQWPAFIVSLGLALLITALVLGALWFIWRCYAQRPPAPLEQLAQEAQGALNALQAGGDIKNVIIRCYFEMSQVLSVQRGIQRQSEMTPREFEVQLKALGLPSRPVQQLTRLFEAVRYGNTAPGAEEERQAVESLSAIIQACKPSL